MAASPPNIANFAWAMRAKAIEVDMFSLRWLLFQVLVHEWLLVLEYVGKPDCEHDRVTSQKTSFKAMYAEPAPSMQRLDITALHRTRAVFQNSPRIHVRTHDRCADGKVRLIAASMQFCNVQPWPESPRKHAIRPLPRSHNVLFTPATKARIVVGCKPGTTCPHASIHGSLATFQTAASQQRWRARRGGAERSFPRYAWQASRAMGLLDIGVQGSADQTPGQILR